MQVVQRLAFIQALGAQRRARKINKLKVNDLQNKLCAIVGGAAVGFIQALGAQRRARLHALRAHGPQSSGAHKALQLPGHPDGHGPLYH
jgi:hypothetical protein